ncbi:MAG: DUF2206 domain-containing protein [Candidatus Bathyarchaeia archaeon]|jgi:uncharacterized membrane protein
MNESDLTGLRPAQLSVTVLVATVALWFSVIFNLVVVREVLGFVYLTFLPGFALLRLLRLKLEVVESIVFAVGLSIAFLMVVGLLLNLLGPLIGISGPLALTPLMVVVTAIVLLLWFVRRDYYDIRVFSFGFKKLIAIGAVASGIIICSVIGAILVNAPPHSNNLILLFTLALISILVGISVFSKRLVPPESYPLILFAIATALLLPVSLFSEYIHGGDIFSEYVAFKLTLSSSFWNPAISGRVYAMLSVTILPTIYSNILGLEPTWILKIVYPLIFAIVPLGVFQLFKSKFGKETAFFSVVFFVSNLVFFSEIVTLARQMIGELFFILLFLTIFSKNIKGYAKWSCFCIFSFGLAVSHYALSYIFLIFIIAFWLFSFFSKRKMSVSVGMVFTFAAITFAWYIYSSASSTFNDLLNMINNITSNFTSDFLNLQSRGSSVLQGTGLESGVGTFWHIWGTYLYYATEILIVVGFLGLLLRQRRSFFKDEYYIMTFLNMALLVACIVVPNLATSFNMTRFYQLSLFFLAPFCVIGGRDIVRFLSRKRIKEKYLLAIVVLAVIIPFFLFQTDFVYEVAKEQSISLPLSSYRLSSYQLTYDGVLKPTEVSGARWLLQFNSLNETIYSDWQFGIMFDYVGIPEIIAGGTIAPSSEVPMGKGSLLYLGEYNIIDGVVSISYGSAPLNITQIDPNLNGTNLVYSSGSSEIYQIP